MVSIHLLTTFGLGVVAAIAFCQAGAGTEQR